MNFKRLAIPDVVLCSPNIIKDERGYFTESFRLDLLCDFLGKEILFCQENQSLSYKNVFRGLHYQKPPFAQSKLITVVSGSILDVVVDLRSNSPYFGQHLIYQMNSEQLEALFVPKGFAHGFFVQSSEAMINYKVDSYYSPAHECGLLVKDPALKIDLGNEDVLRCVPKDLEHPLLEFAFCFENKK